MSFSADTTVRHLLALSGVTPNEAEIAAMIEQFAPSRASIDALYRVQGVRYESPAIGFTPFTQ
jgi:hypothetical protein